MFRKTLFVAALPFALAACTPGEQGAAIGAVGGALVGSALSSDQDRDKGALIGAGLGAIAGGLIGEANSPGQCYYHDGRGGRYIAPC
jgi:outer membrane lipoprotein SlyB